MTSVAAGVSVLIPCRNGEAFLQATLESVIAQTAAATEVVVVDDGSTDRTVEIARQFAPLVRVVANEGRGVSAARTCAMHLASGAFFQFLDADDLLTPRAIETRVAMLEATGADIAISDWRRLTPAGGAWHAGRVESGGLNQSEPPEVSILRGFWAPPAAVLYRRAICLAIGAWSASLPVIQDARFLLDAARLDGRFVHVPEIGAEYRQHTAGSVSTRNPTALWHDILKNGVEVEALWRTAGRLDDLHREALANLYAGCARVGFTRDRSLYVEALGHLQRFPEVPTPRFLRVASGLLPVLGYPATRWLLRAGAAERTS